MKRSTIIVATIALSATAASAQEFKGDCTAYRTAGKAACDATQWCRWVQPTKSITLPNGQQYTRPGYCAFKAGFKQAWKAQAQQPAQR